MLTLPAARIYLLTSFVWGLLFWMMATVSMIYQVEMAGLGPLELVLVGTALEVSAFLFEVPTGLLADRYSRRLSVMIGYLITGVAFVVSGSFPTFTAIALGSFLWGIGWTFISGAQEAWLADELGTAEAGGLYLKGKKLSSYGSFVGIFLAVLIGSVQINYPYILAGILFILWGIYIRLAMPETGFEPDHSGAPERESYLSMVRSGVRVIRGNRVLILLMIVGVIIGTFSEGYDRLSTAHLLRDFTFPSPGGLQPVVLFGIMTSLGSLATIIVVELMERRVNTESAIVVARWLSVLTGLMVLSVMVFALTGSVWLAILMLVLIQPLRGVVDPLTMAWLNQHIPGRIRATVISMHSQSDALGQIGGGPAVGTMAQLFGIRTALSLAAFLLTPAVWLYLQHDETD